MNLLRRNSRPKEGKENAPSQLPKPASDVKPKLGLRQQPEPVQEQSAPPLQEAPMQQRRSRRPRPAAFPPEPILSPIRGPVASAPSTAGAGEDRVTLEDWSFAFNASRPLQLTGRIFNNGSGYEDGDLLEYTSQIVSINGRSAVTKSGTVYRLGKPSASFDQLRKQLWINSRTGALGRDDGSSVPPMDEDQPLLGIKLGEVTATAPVRLPRVPGWSHQSGVALLNEWSTEKTGSGFVSVVGSVFNCPGACKHLAPRTCLLTAAAR